MAKKWYCLYTFCQNKINNWHGWVSVSVNNRWIEFLAKLIWNKMNEKSKLIDKVVLTHKHILEIQSINSWLWRKKLDHCPMYNGDLLQWWPQYCEWTVSAEPPGWPGQFGGQLRPLPHPWSADGSHAWLHARCTTAVTDRTVVNNSCDR